MSYRHLYTVVAHKRPVMVLCYNVETGEDEVLPLFKRELEAWLGSERKHSNAPGPGVHSGTATGNISYPAGNRGPSQVEDLITPLTWETFPAPEHYLVPCFPTPDRSLPGSSRYRDKPRRWRYGQTD
jgi:hypothetical protein